MSSEDESRGCNRLEVIETVGGVVTSCSRLTSVKGASNKALLSGTVALLFMVMFWQLMRLLFILMAKVSVEAKGCPLLEAVGRLGGGGGGARCPP